MNIEYYKPIKTQATVHSAPFDAYGRIQNTLLYKRLPTIQNMRSKYIQIHIVCLLLKDGLN